MNIHLYNGECLEVMERLIDKGVKVDAIITDPPYGTTACSWDSVIPFDKMWENLNRLIKDNGPIILFSAQPFTTKLIESNFSKFKYQLIWKKNVPTGMSQAKYRPMRYHEEIIVFNTSPKSTYNPIMKERVGVGKSCYKYDHYCGKSNHVDMDKIKKRYDPDFVQPSSVLEFDVVPNRKGKVHPTQKPVSLMEYLVKTYTNEGDTVLDFTMGSGTTGVACKNLNRNFIGMELDGKYFEIAKNRIESEPKGLFELEEHK